MTDVFPFVLERFERYVSLFFRNTPNVGGYRILGQRTLDDAYGPANGVGGLGAVTLFELTRGQTLRSNSIQQRGLGILDENYRNQTKVIYDPMDVFVPGGGQPNDRELAYLRVQTRTPGGAFPALGTADGPILLLQPPGFSSVPRPAVTLSGTAPDLATAAAGSTPPITGAMRIRVPQYGDSLVFTNHDEALPIFLSTGMDMPFMRIDPSQSISHTSGMKDSYVIAANGGNPTFSMLIATVNGQR